MKIYFDNVLLNEDYIIGLEQEQVLFNDDESFKLGSTPCNTFKLKLSKDYVVNDPTSVTIYNGNDLYATLRMVKKEASETSYNYTLEDAMTLFEFYYSAKEVIEANGGTATLKQIVQDMCTKVGVTLKNSSWTNSDLVVGIYDNTYTARQYIGFIAELNGGYAIIDENGQLEFKQYNSTSVKTIGLDDISNYEIGEHHKVERVVFDNGLIHYESDDDETKETLYITSDNPYIGDQQILNSIANVINNFDFYSFSTDNAPIYNDLVIGNIITIGTYKTVVQKKYTYNGGWVGGYKFKVKSPSQSETDYSGINSEFKRLIVKQDLTDASLKILSEKVVAVSDIVTGTGSIQLENAYEGQLYQLSIKGNISLLYPQNEKLYGYPLAPHDGLVPSNTLVPSNPVPYDNEVHYPSSDLFTKSTILTIDDTEYKLDFNFLNYMNSTTYDEFVYDNGKCYIIRRVGIDENDDMYALDNEVIEPRESITLNVKSNSTITLNSFNNAILTANYLLDNAYTQNFATQVEVSTEIEQTADSILGQVVKDNEVVAKMNLALEDGQGIVRFVSNQFVVDSDNFKVSSDGTITANAGIIGGFHISNNFNNNFYGLYDYSYYDLMALIGGYLDWINLDSTTFNILDINEDNQLDADDISAIINHITGYMPINRSFAGKVEINSDDAKNCLTIKDINGNNAVQIGLGGVGANNGIFRNIICSDNYSTSDVRPAVYINGVTGKVHATGGYNQGSKVELKKNIEKFDNALEEIKNTDIYKYNYKTEEDDSKKHIGFIIGDDYKCSKEITSVDDKGNSNGVDLYSFISVCCQAIKEQQDLIDNLQQRIEALEKKESDK